MEKILIVDGHNLLFRMFYGMQRPIYNSDGKDIRAVIGFVSNLNRTIHNLKPDKVFVAFDSESSTEERLKLFGEYKQNRFDYTQVADEDNPFLQLPMILICLEHMQIAHKVVTSCEADDYIASLAKKYESRAEVIILSTDRDFLQLVSETVKVFSQSGKNSILFDLGKVVEKLSVRPNQIVDYKALVGDASDNLPGVKGIGPKTAVKLLEFGTLDVILSGGTKIPVKHYDKLKANEETIELMKKVIKMQVDVTMDFDERELSGFKIMNDSRKVLINCGIY